jgi:hypothetical protein
LLCWAARLGRWQKAKTCRLRLLFQSQPEAQDQERGRENSALEDRGSMQGPTLHKPAHLQLSTAAAGRDIGKSPAIRIAIQCGHFLVHWLRSTISITLEMSFVEVTSFNGSAGGRCATGTLQLSSEQTSKPDVRHQTSFDKNQRHGVRLGSLVTLAHRLGNARVLTFSM